MSDIIYDIARIADDCFDVYMSDDGGYTWEYYATYEREDWAVEEAEAALLYISHDK